MSPLLNIELEPGIVAVSFTAPRYDSFIVAVLVNGVDICAEYSRFDLGKRIFLDDVPGFDRAAFNRGTRRHHLGCAIARLIHGGAL